MYLETSKLNSVSVKYSKAIWFLFKGCLNFNTTTYHCKKYVTISVVLQGRKVI